MLTRFKSGRLKVAAGLYEWQDEFSSYDRKEGVIVKENDDLLSATHIGVMQIRSAKPPQGAYRGIMVGAPAEELRRVNDRWNIFTGEPE